MLRESMNGFCMALADSVPGVSGGTVAFIMGFYNRFIDSINDVIFGPAQAKKMALKYLAKLGMGWFVGMATAVFMLAALFEKHIYVVSSLFIGFIAGALPLIIIEEKESLRKIGCGIFFGVLGILLVIIITWANSRIGNVAMNLGNFSIGLATKLFFIGMLAIAAMFLPGISGSTLLLIFGAYIPVITAVKGVLAFDFSYIPCLLFFICGLFAGAVTIVKIIKLGLEKFRPQIIYLILGMMLGSFYAIIMGPTTLDTAQAALGWPNFHIAAAVVGAILVLIMQMLKEKRAGKEH